MNKVHPGPVHRRILAWALIAIGALSVGGCGVRGSLEAPPAATTETGGATPGTPGQPAPHKPFILDPLLR
jgi:predicted small lipoprotein YifL